MNVIEAGEDTPLYETGVQKLGQAGGRSLHYSDKGEVEFVKQWKGIFVLHPSEGYLTLSVL